MLQLANEERRESSRDEVIQEARIGVAVPLPGAERSHTDQQATEGSGSRNEFLAKLLKDAERLLAYSAETGIKVEPDVRGMILKARSTAIGKWDEQTADQMVDALARLAQQLKPVSIESLCDCEEQDEKKAMWSYKRLAIVLAVFIIPYSLAAFVTSAISEKMRKDIVVANELAVKLTDELNVFQPGSASATPARTDITRADRMTMLKDLQHFAATTRAIDGRARLLSLFVGGVIHDPFAELRGQSVKLKETFEVPLPLPDLSTVAASRIAVYQQVRYFAVAVEETASVFYGAMASCILPVLYALLGACAFLLRSLEQQVKARTFTLNDAHAARFVIAAIGGAVVGLFSNFTTTQVASIPPLAIAFLVGYAVDVFFSFLEGLLQTVARGKTAGPVPLPDRRPVQA
jgi:hypothetical protein